MKLVLLCCNLIFFTLINYSQKVLTYENQLVLENTPTNDIARFGDQRAEENKKIGTFQLIISNPEVQYAITDDFLKWVEENRLKDQDQTFQIIENISVIIFSKEKIEAANFQPVSTVFYSGKP